METEKLERYSSFYRMDLQDGPLLGCFLGTYYPLNRFQGARTLPEGAVAPSDLDPEAFRSDYLRMHGQYAAAGGDALYSASLLWGIPWMEVLSGCTAFADHSTGSMRSVAPSPPCPADIPYFSESTPWVEKADQFLRMLASLEVEMPVGTTLMRGFSDLLSALYGTPEFVYRLVDGGNDIREIIHRLADLWIAFANFQLDRIQPVDGGVGSYFYSMWLPGRGVWLQEDASALLSPELFEEFIMPAVRRVISAFDTVLMHLHPAGYIPVDQLVETDLTAIELHIDKGGPSAEELLPYYRTIQSKKPLVIWGDLTYNDLVFVRDNLDSRALSVIPVIEQPGEAAQVRELFVK